MRLTCLIQFLTFVLMSTTSMAAPTTRIPPKDMKPAQETSTETSTPLEVESVEVTKQAPVSLDTDRIVPTRIVRDATWNLGFGLWSGPLKEQGNAIQTQVLSFTRTQTDLDETAWEYGADVTANGMFGGHGHFKIYCCMGENFEPYMAVGVAGLYKASDLLAGFVKTSSYQVQAGGGFEDLFGFDRRLRLEGFLGQSTWGTSILIRIGYAFDEDFLNF